MLRLVDNATAALGPSLRSLRGARTMTLAEPGALVGTSESHLSRIETCKRADISRNLIARLAKALDASTRLARAAQDLPAERESQIAAHAGAPGAAFDRMAAAALRRLDSLPAGKALRARTPNVIRGVQAESCALCRFHGCDPHHSTVVVAPQVTLVAAHPAAGVPRRAAINPGGGTGPATRLRSFEPYEAVQLEVGSHACSLLLLTSPEEVRFVDTTCAALTLRTRLDRALGIAPAGASDTGGSHDISSTPGATPVEDVPTLPGIPAWVAVRRLAERMLLGDQALYESMPRSAA